MFSISFGSTALDSRFGPGRKKHSRARLGFRFAGGRNVSILRAVGVGNKYPERNGPADSGQLARGDFTSMADPLLIAKGDSELSLLPKMANRHGLVAGATGTGKTVTLQVMAEALSRAGVPIFMADVKGDLSGISQPGTAKPKIEERVRQLGLRGFQFSASPVAFWDVFGEQGHPVRATISEMGPLLLSRLLNLNETQSGVLAIVFRIADDNGLLLLDLKDLRAMVQFVGDHAKDFKTDYGNISAASIGAIQRGLLVLEQQGGDKFFGEPALDLLDLVQTDT